ncbi:tail fiber assembly protein [Pseudomonas bohemica]|uniref:tail fiber assembly protein n=1 Tax=Pseudomonas bohemica TaxID=2044872 RepID=UPI002D783BA6|nr:tail fiber assembly protein [Pseudomonas bohemica]
MYVQFDDETQAKIITVFSEPQDPEFWPNQGEVDEADQRYIDFLSLLTPSALVVAQAERDRLLGVAALAIAPLQDAVDLDEATDDEVALLKNWKTFRVAVNRVSQQAAYPEDIDWPVAPRLA